MQKSVELPTAGDIILLSRFIQQETKEAIHYKDQEWLVELALSGLLLFNKRRPMEVEELTFADSRRAAERKRDRYTNEVVKSQKYEGLR